MIADNAHPRLFVFRCIRGPATLSFTIAPGQTLTVGRGGLGVAVDVRISCPAVSRQHFRVRNDGTTCSIQELRTRGGIPILRAAIKERLTADELAEALKDARSQAWQELPVEQWQPLEPGDVIALPDCLFELHLRT